jgi:hypothetical protein
VEVEQLRARARPRDGVVGEEPARDSERHREDDRRVGKRVHGRAGLDAHAEAAGMVRRSAATSSAWLPRPSTRRTLGTRTSKACRAGVD